MLGNRRRYLALLAPAFVALSLAGCANDTVAPDPDGGVGGRRQSATLEWNRLALDMIEKYKPGQQAALHGGAELDFHAPITHIHCDARFALQFQVFLGANGAGKTTTLRMVMHVFAPDSGSIEVLGGPADLAVRAARLRRRTVCVASTSPGSARRRGSA